MPRSTRPAPAARMAPTMITELMALVTLMSGVCSAGVTCPDHVVADEDRQHEDHQIGDDRIDGDVRATSAPRRGGAVDADERRRR